MRNVEAMYFSVFCEISINMGLILCPECGAKISNKALTCPRCGFVSENSKLPISIQDKYEPIPVFKYEINEWDPQPVSYEDNKALVEYFGNWNNIQLKIPAIAEVIKSLAIKDNYMVAKIPDYIKKMIESGSYCFSIDKSGEILPTIRDANGIVKQVRLENMSFSPNAGQSLVNLSNQMKMAQIASDIKYIGNVICSVRDELQNDRLALADAVMQQLQQALLIEDSSLRNNAILGVIHKATEAKCTLIRNYELNYQYLVKEKNKSFWQHLNIKDETQVKAKDAMKDIVAITNVVQIECAGYSALGEYDSEKKCLLQFKDFIVKNKLSKRDTLLTINEAFELKNVDFVNQFESISKKITKFDNDGLIEMKNSPFLISEDNEDE